ncbi:hypothetical protein ABL78_8413 [Leptomonas seymouri]|uniref:Uncharacterized protein n=1 Tax=Leptomonas seymouri TaxID=5684 RepID=A0A0N0P2J1_LEPSE|nr:hypothetical protein ABL78_8413 [Leptomonas seymouri]|eukprot:KPI82577.1 hypothetical protein ABL78_8413 [Leptomonas seymouri]
MASTDTEAFFSPSFITSSAEKAASFSSPSLSPPLVFLRPLEVSEGSLMLPVVLSPVGARPTTISTWQGSMTVLRDCPNLSLQAIDHTSSPGCSASGSREKAGWKF